MSINKYFAIWCAKQCVSEWKPSIKIIDWLNYPCDNHDIINPVKELVRKAPIHLGSKSHSARVTVYAAILIWEEGTASRTWTRVVLDNASHVLGITIDEIKMKYVATWTDEQLAITDPEWIQYATAELFSR